MAVVQIRYIVTEMEKAISFYTSLLGFKLEMNPSPAFAMLSLGDLRLVLSVPNPSAGGGQAMPDGSRQTPGGWNRFAVQVADLSKTVDNLSRSGVHFRNTIVTGAGGKQIIVDDPSGNPVELFEPTLPEARLDSRRRKRDLQLAMSFWAGVGLMSIINVWKISGGNDAILYSWIMSGVSALILIICLIYLISINQKSKIK